MSKISSLRIGFALLVTAAIAGCQTNSTPPIVQQQLSTTQPSPNPTASPAKKEDPPQETLRSLAEARGFYVGAAVASRPLAEEPDYQKTLAQQYNMVVPENEMKFASIHPTKDKYTFEKADALVAFAEKNKMQVRGHTLVWHNQVPKWISEGQFSKDELKAILKEHIQTVVAHYRGKVKIWDVVNEAFNDNGALRETVWSKGIGPEYIELAYQWAHEADPDALLFYNDYNNERVNAKSDKILNMVKQLQEKKIPIHGIGFQSHVSSTGYPKPEPFKENLQRFTALGLQVQITELDVKVSDNSASPEDKSKQQAKAYGDMLNACLSMTKCTAFLTWGFTDKYTWLRDKDKDERPLIFDPNYQPKPAYQALKDGLKTN